MGQQTTVLCFGCDVEGGKPVASAIRSDQEPDVVLSGSADTTVGIPGN